MLFLLQVENFTALLLISPGISFELECVFGEVFMKIKKMKNFRPSNLAIDT